MKKIVEFPIYDIYDELLTEICLLQTHKQDWLHSDLLKRGHILPRRSPLCSKVLREKTACPVWTIVLKREETTLASYNATLRHFYGISLRNVFLLGNGTLCDRVQALNWPEMQQKEGGGPTVLVPCSFRASFIYG